MLTDVAADMAWKEKGVEEGVCPVPTLGNDVYLEKK